MLRLNGSAGNMLIFLQLVSLNINSSYGSSKTPKSMCSITVLGDRMCPLPINGATAMALRIDEYGAHLLWIAAHG